MSPSGLSLPDMTLNRLIFALLALLGLSFSACERHELSETAVLHQGHGGHDDHGYDKHGKDHGDDAHAKDDAHEGGDHGDKKGDHAGDHGDKADGKGKGDDKGGEKGEPRDLGI